MPLFIWIFFIETISIFDIKLTKRIQKTTDPQIDHMNKYLAKRWKLAYVKAEFPTDLEAWNWTSVATLIDITTNNSQLWAQGGNLATRLFKTNIYQLWWLAWQVAAPHKLDNNELFM